MNPQQDRWSAVTGWVIAAFLAVMILSRPPSVATAADILETGAGVCLLIWASRRIRQKPHRDD